MYELPHAIPDPQVLLNLQPEELGGKILFLLRKRSEQPNRAPQDFIFAALSDSNARRNRPRYLRGMGVAYRPGLTCAEAGSPRGHR